MLSNRLWKPVAAGTVVTAVLFVFPETYQYAPVAGGVIAGVVGGNYRDGISAGLATGLGMLPVACLLTLVSLFTISGPVTGIDVLFESMRGIGPQGLVFYFVVVYFVVAYTAIAGGFGGFLGGSLSGLFASVDSSS